MTQTLLHPVASSMVDSEPADKYWTTSEYEKLIDAGMLEQQRLQLIFGRILQMFPQYVPHSIAIELIDEQVRKAFSGKRIRIQLPLNLQDDSQPEPDIAIVEGRARGSKSHPDKALLVVEVADASLRFDRTVKSKLYALNGIPEYWIVNLVEMRLEVFREPTLEPVAQYKSMIALTAAESVVPLAAPTHSILVSDLLP